MSKEGRAEMSSSSNQGKNKEENAKLDNKSPFLFSFLSPGNEEEGIAQLEHKFKITFYGVSHESDFVNCTLSATNVS